MSQCLNYSRCNSSSTFRFYLYEDTTRVNRTEYFESIWSTLKSHPKRTLDPNSACLFFPNIDGTYLFLSFFLLHSFVNLSFSVVTDLDPLSAGMVEKNLSRIFWQLHELPFWNGGTNHVLWNLYTGTFPDYAYLSGLDIGLF
jgi:hypothetical protein